MEMKLSMANILAAEVKDDRPTLLEVKHALDLIVKHCEDVTLNYCVNYAKYAIHMIVNGHSEKDLKRQILYVDNNYEDWTGQDARLSKSILKKFADIE